MSRSNRSIAFGLVILALVLSLAAVAWELYHTPLGPALQPTSTPSPAPTPVASTPTAIPATAVSQVCGETGAWNLLVIGSDEAEKARGSRGSDLTRVLHLDFTGRKVASFYFPRDLWVDGSALGLKDPAVNEAALGTFFYEARRRSTATDARSAMRDGSNAIALLLASTFGTGTDHYLALDLAQLPAMVDEIGGVTVDVPQAIEDVPTGIRIPAGKQLLQGKEFMAYARARPDSDYARIERNNLLLEALRAKLLDPELWLAIPDLYIKFSDVISTDLTPGQINHLACLLREVPEGAMVQDGVRPEWTLPGPKPESLLWDEEAVQARLQELGLAP